jgi:guanosine-3',5'-bis(diphosphate) 3'-pyrophosphohydrolase
MEERTRAIDLGRKVFEKELRRYDLNVKALQESDVFTRVLGEIGAKTPEDLFAQVGYGTLSVKQLLGKLVPPDRLREKPPDGFVAAAVKRAFGPSEEKIKVRGQDDVLVVRARCCNPIRGESIVGYITRGKGVSVHSATCPNVMNLLYDPERRIEVEWDKAAGAEAVASYTVSLTMEVEDRKGLLAAVSARIADINTNIKNMEARTDDGDHHARIDVTVEISDLRHLEKVIKSLKGVKGVLDVSRTGGSGRSGGSGG